VAGSIWLAITSQQQRRSAYEVDELLAARDLMFQKKGAHDGGKRFVPVVDVEVPDKMEIGRKWAARDGKAVENSSKPSQETQAHVPQD
jgi:hypothetical protein